jgi:hypothetical protein
VKENELRHLSTCAVCGLKIGQTPIPVFWKVTIERHGIDMNAVRRQSGLAMMLGGNGVLASVMGPDDEMTQKLMGPVTMMVCDSCGCGSETSIAGMAFEADKTADGVEP